MVDQDLFDRFLLLFGQSNDTALKLSNILTLDTGFIHDVPSGATNDGAARTCDVGIENVLHCHEFIVPSPDQFSPGSLLQSRPLREASASLGPPHRPSQ